MKSDWETVKLRSVCDVFADGDWIESKDQSSKGIRLIQTGNISTGYFKNKEEKARFISEETFKRLRCTEILNGDCLISRLPDPIGRSCIIPEINEKMITAVDCTIIHFKKNRVVSDYFNYYSQSNQYLNDIEHQTTGTTRKRISRNKLGEIEIPVPPLTEQRRIVAILDEAFAAIAKAKENTEKNLQNARELFESYLNNVFANPGHDWEEKLLGLICDVITKGTTPTTMKFEYVKTGINFVKIEAIDQSGLIILSKLTHITEECHNSFKRSQLHENDILFSIAGALGRSVIVQKEILPANTNQALSIIRLSNIDYSLPKYIWYLLKSDFVLDQIKNLKAGVAQLNLSLEQIRKLHIFIPTNLEQHSIIARLNKYSALSKRLEAIYQQKLTDLEELKKSILQKAFEGELTGV